MDYLAQHIESLIFTADQPISLKDLKATLDELFETKFQEEDLLQQVEWLINRYKADQFAIEIIEIGGGYQFFSKGAYHKTIGQHLKRNSKKRLSQSALETLSIIAYKQPVTKTELEQIRGVGCDYSIQKLLEKELISIAGRSEGPGRPLLYGTSGKFMDYFGLKSMRDLPKTKDFKEPEEQIGEQAPIEEPKE